MRWGKSNQKFIVKEESMGENTRRTRGAKHEVNGKVGRSGNKNTRPSDHADVNGVAH